MIDKRSEMTGPVFPQLKRCGPVSNTERQRQFRERNPGYYGRLHRKRKAAIRARLEPIWAEARAQAHAEAQLAAAQPAPVLMLPAPGIDPLTSEIAKCGALAESLKNESAAVEIARKRVSPSL